MIRLLAAIAVVVASAALAAADHKDASEAFMIPGSHHDKFVQTIEALAQRREMLNASGILPQKLDTAVGSQKLDPALVPAIVEPATSDQFCGDSNLFFGIGGFGLGISLTVCNPLTVTLVIPGDDDIPVVGPGDIPGFGGCRCGESPLLFEVHRQKITPLYLAALVAFISPIETRTTVPCIMTKLHRSACRSVYISVPNIR